MSLSMTIRETWKDTGAAKSVVMYPASGWASVAAFQKHQIARGQENSRETVTAIASGVRVVTATTVVDVVLG